MFKEKTSKKRIHNLDNLKDHYTLDAIHINTIKKYSSKSDEKQLYIDKLNTIIENQDIIKNKLMITNNNHINYNLLWNSNIELKEDYIKLNNKIREINDFNEIEYYENTGNILFNYYDMIDKQTNNISNNKSIIDLFKVKDNNEIIVKKNEDDKNIKSFLVDEYLSMTNKQYIKKIESNEECEEICKNCKNKLTCIQHEAIIICDKCGFQELLLVEQNRPILKQNTKDTSHFSYKRINHFREWSNQVQGKESTDIPDEIFSKILNEIKKEKIQDTKTITYSKMREILKRLRINKYYEHINYIINRINGIPTPQFSTELEDKLCNMFKEIQGPFLKFCPKERKNFLSYSYVLYKFFQILDLTEYLKFFPLLKSREKLYVQDQIWKKICEELNYKFIPSL